MKRASIACGMLLVACGTAPPRASEPGREPTRESQLATDGDDGRPPPVIAVAPPEPAEEPPSPPTAAVAVGSASGWPTFHGNAERTGASTAPAIRRPRILWKTKLGVFSWLNTPLALGDTVVVVPSSGKAHNKPDPGDGVSALDAKTGKALWFAHFDQDANGVAADAKRVYATSDDGNAYAIELRTGKIAWKQAGLGKMYTNPLLLADRVIVGDAGGWVRALATADGKELWSLQLTGAIRGGASSDGKLVYVASQGGEVAALDPNTGKARWRVPVDRPAWNNQGPNEPIEVYAVPVVGRDAIYVTFARDTTYTDQPAVVALDKRNGRVKWRAKGPGSFGNIRTTPVLLGDKLVYGEPYSGDVVAVNAGSGRMAYRKTIGPCYFPQWSSPAAAGSTVYLPRFDGAVYALDSGSGKVEWELYLGDSTVAGSPRPNTPPSRYGCEWDVPSGFAIYAPAAVGENGTLYVGTNEGLLFAIGE
jgi:outer membrane protein assembly factor BamB